MNVPASELGEGFPGAAAAPAVQEAGFINTRLAVVGAIASAAAVLAPVSVMAADGAFAAERPAGTELFIGDQASQPSVTGEQFGHPQMGVGSMKRTHCVASGASKYLAVRASADRAEGVKVKPYGRITNITHGNFSAPAFTPETNDITRENLKFHLNSGKNFPASNNLNADFYFKFTLHGKTYVEKSLDYRINERGC